MTSPADLIVVGAGAAGLMAAQEASESGLSVMVLEANDRVGGRIKTGEVAGRVVDFGAQWVGAGQTVLRAQAERFGIVGYPQNEAGKTVTELAGRLAATRSGLPRASPLALLELARLQARWGRDVRALGDAPPWDAPQAPRWDATTLDTWIERHLRTREARAFARFACRGAFAVDASEVSYLWWLEAVRGAGGLSRLLGIAGGGQEAKFAGGMHQVLARTAEALGERIVLGAPARLIRQDAEGVAVASDKGVFRARRAILALPPAAAARIAFDPALPARRSGLHQRMGMGAIIKATVAYERPFWREAGFSGQIVTDDDVLGLVMDDVAPYGPPFLLPFIEGRRALEMSAAGKEARRAAVIASLVRFFGPEAGKPIAYDDNDWTAEPWSIGYVGVMGPGVMSRYGAALREPVGRLHFAGAETATEFPGYVEGAMRSGVRAAREVIALHNT